MRSAEAVATMHCPICKTGLTLSDRSGVEIDHCQTCRGVWLDRGELDKIIERSVADAPPARPQPEPERQHYQSGGHRDDDDYRYQGNRRKKKSFLSEMFD